MQEGTGLLYIFFQPNKNALERNIARIARYSKKGPFFLHSCRILWDLVRYCKNLAGILYSNISCKSIFTGLNYNKQEGTGIFIYTPSILDNKYIAPLKHDQLQSHTSTYLQRYFTQPLLIRAFEWHQRLNFISLRIFGISIGIYSLVWPDRCIFTGHYCFRYKWYTLWI